MRLTTSFIARSSSSTSVRQYLFVFRLLLFKARQIRQIQSDKVRSFKMALAQRRVRNAAVILFMFLTASFLMAQTLRTPEGIGPDGKGGLDPANTIQQQ